MLRPVTPFIALLLLAGCATAPKAYEGVDYSKSTATRMNVGAVLVDSAFKPSGMEPNVEHQLTPQPEDVLRTAIGQHYASARPNAAGAPVLRFTIKDASVTEQKLPQPTGWWAQQTNTAPAYRYAGRLEVESKTEGASRTPAFVHAEATRSLELGNMSPAERERQVQGMVHQMVDDVMQQLDTQIDSNMGGIVLSGADMTISPTPTGRWDKVMNWK